jgi:ATP-dependent protease Clp ATPase subunit
MKLEDLTPILKSSAELDKFIIGQTKAKKAVAIALRNRMRRQKLPGNDARGDRPEEHHHDRSDRRRKDRDRSTSGEASRERPS